MCASVKIHGIVATGLPRGTVIIGTRVVVDTESPSINEVLSSSSRIVVISINARAIPSAPLSAESNIGSEDKKSAEAVSSFNLSATFCHA